MGSHCNLNDVKVLTAEDIGHGLTEYKLTVQVKAATYEKLTLDEVEGSIICGIQDAITDTLGTSALDIRFIPISK